MSREKQIEEITNELIFTSNYGNKALIAKHLYEKGYRKQRISEGDPSNELIEIIKPYVSAYACEEESGSCELTNCRRCNALNLAKEIHNAGYRKQEWISVEERLPEPEKEVLVFAIRKYRSNDMWWEVPIITTAMYEDGTISKEDSEWNWYDIDFIYDEENDIEYIPEGWWEDRKYNADEVYNNPVDDKVTHWMPLPEAPKMKGGRSDDAI